jgi:hypothetical protein
VRITVTRFDDPLYRLKYVFKGLIADAGTLDCNDYSPEYMAARKIGESYAKYNVIAVDGVQ